MAGHLADATANLIVQLAQRSPPIAHTKLGEPIAPPAGALRKFLEFENAVHDLPGVLSAVAHGAVTRVQAEALQACKPSIAARITRALLDAPDRLRKLAPVRLKAVELLTGGDLTGAADGGYLLRQMSAWQVAGQKPAAAPANKAGGGKPQALKITDQSTPSQAYGSVPAQ